MYFYEKQEDLFEIERELMDFGVDSLFDDHKDLYKSGWPLLVKCLDIILKPQVTAFWDRHISTIVFTAYDMVVLFIIIRRMINTVDFLTEEEKTHLDGFLSFMSQWDLARLESEIEWWCIDISQNQFPGKWVSRWEHELWMDWSPKVEHEKIEDLIETSMMHLTKFCEGALYPRRLRNMFSFYAASLRFRLCFMYWSVEEVVSYMQTFRESA